MTEATQERVEDLVRLGPGDDEPLVDRPGGDAADAVPQCGAGRGLDPRGERLGVEGGAGVGLGDAHRGRLRHEHLRIAEVEAV